MLSAFPVLFVLNKTEKFLDVKCKSCDWSVANNAKFAFAYFRISFVFGWPTSSNVRDETRFTGFLLFQEEANQTFAL